MIALRRLNPDELEKVSRFADAMVVAVAMCLPWSTSATAICTGLWLAALIPTIEPERFKRLFAEPAVWLPCALFGLAVLGMIWADVSWAHRLDGVGSYLKLLAIPLLLFQFSGSRRGTNVLTGFLVACTALLLLSWLSTLTPNGRFWETGREFGVPVKDYISQSAMFTICALVLLYYGIGEFQHGRRLRAFAAFVLSALFLGNMLYVVSSRTALVTIPFLILMLAARVSIWRSAAGLGVAAIVLAGAVWTSSDYVVKRLGGLADELETSQTSNVRTSAGDRYEFWQRSLVIMQDAPIIGHGTGSIRESFERAAARQTGGHALVTDNPHNQTFAVGIQLGLAGIFLLYAMWWAHFALFREPGLAAWAGAVIVVQNFIGSLFNSHLFDSTHTSLYVFGVGVLGGMMLQKRMSSPAASNVEKTIPAQS